MIENKIFERLKVYEPRKFIAILYKPYKDITRYLCIHESDINNIKFKHSLVFVKENLFFIKMYEFTPYTEIPAAEERWTIKENNELCYVNIISIKKEHE